jgi:hypothetical protein
MVSSQARLIIAVGLSSALSCHALHAQAPASPPASFDIMDATIDRIHAAMKSDSLSCVALVENFRRWRSQAASPPAGFRSASS